MYPSKCEKDILFLYFLEFLDVRSKDMDNKEMIESLYDMLNRALVQMTAEKMDKNDFHIFSRLLQQEISNLRT